MAQLNRHFWAANVTVRGATRRDTERVESVRGGKCAKCGVGDNVCLCRCQGFICGCCCGTLQVARCEFCSWTSDVGRGTLRRTADAGRWICGFNTSRCRAGIPTLSSRCKTMLHCRCGECNARQRPKLCRSLLVNHKHKHNAAHCCRHTHTQTQRHRE